MSRYRNPFRIPRMPRGTLRPQNYCKQCHYSWYPRGKSLSPRCPNCGSQDTAVSTIGLFGGVGLLIVVGIVAYAINKSSGRADVVFDHDSGNQFRREASEIRDSRNEHQVTSNQEFTKPPESLRTQNEKRSQTELENKVTVEKELKRREEEEAKRLQLEQDAKELELRKKESELKAKREQAAKELEAKLAAVKSIDEEKAKDLLKSAKRWLSLGSIAEKEVGIRRIEELLRRFPSSEAAAEGKKLLETINQKKP